MINKNHQRNRFMTLLYSLVPGCGQMYLGFMNLGLSILLLFFGTIMLASWFYVSSLYLLLPVIWLYGFFDSLNKRDMTPEDLAAQEDRFLFDFNRRLGGLLSGRFRPAVAAALIFTGAYQLLKCFLDMFTFLLPKLIGRALINSFRTLPQLVFSLLIIYIGFRLITARKQEPDRLE